MGKVEEITQGSLERRKKGRKRKKKREKELEEEIIIGIEGVYGILMSSFSEAFCFCPRLLPALTCSAPYSCMRV